MYLPFNSLPGHSRLWIYQADRSFSSEEMSTLQQDLRELCDQWSAHGTPLHSSFMVAFNQFVIMAVDEQKHGASGCSIDGSVRYLKSLESKLNLHFFDRTKVAFLEKEKVTVYPLSSLKTLFQSQTLSSESITFNNLVATKAEWGSDWQTQVKNSWLASYLPKSAVAE